MEAIIDNYSCWINEIDPTILVKDFEKILQQSKFGLLNFMEHNFEPQGYTAIWLLAESHFAIHTFPEQNKTYIELSSCNREMYYQFLKHLEEYKKLVINKINKKFKQGVFNPS